MRSRTLLGAAAGLVVAALAGLLLLSPSLLGLGAAAAGAGGPGSSAATASAAAAARRAAGGLAPLPAGASYVGLVAPSRTIQFGLSLRMRSTAMGRYATAVQTGRAPALNAAQIGRRFGVGAGTLADVRAMLGAAGVQVTETFPQRTEMLVRAPAAAVRRLFGVRLGRFRTSSGKAFYRPLDRPRVPAALARAVVLPTMLDTTPVATYEDVPSAGLTQAQLSMLYDSRPLYGAGLDGSGMTVAIFSADTFLPSDVNAFDHALGISGAPPVQRVQVGGPVSFDNNADAAGEVDLDIDVIRELAPRAQIINYETSRGPEAWGAVIDRIVQDGRAKLVNMSYGVCELYSPQQFQQEDNSFRAAAIANVTVFVSSGDEGSYECGRLDPTNHQLTVPWPTSSPYVVSVGGTHVNLRTDGTRLDEFGWEGVLSRSGGGGGLSRLFRRPSWQSGVSGVQNGFSDGARQVPDVSADAAPSSGYGVVTQGQATVFGGTSAAAPLWTGSMALVDEYISRRTGRMLPFIAPLLYRVAARDPYAFYDVRLGGNRYYRAGPGWDYSTGLGTPDFTRITNDLLTLVK